MLGNAASLSKVSIIAIVPLLLGQRRTEQVVQLKLPRHTLKLFYGAFLELSGALLGNAEPISQVLECTHVAVGSQGETAADNELLTAVQLLEHRSHQIP